jgi:hypothetical protein
MSGFACCQVLARFLAILIYFVEKGIHSRYDYIVYEILSSNSTTGGTCDFTSSPAPGTIKQTEPWILIRQGLFITYAPA